MRNGFYKLMKQNGFAFISTEKGILYQMLFALEDYLLIILKLILIKTFLKAYLTEAILVQMLN